MAKESEREARRGVRDAVKHGIKAAQATIWGLRFLMLIWSIWFSLYLAHESLRTGLRIALAALWAISVYADVAQEWAWQLMILMWPQWILSILLTEERSIRKYAQKYKFLETHKKRRGGSVTYCSKYGIGVWRGFIDVIINANYHNKSWAGSFSLQDLRMSGHRCRIKREPVFAGTDANLHMDLARLAELIISEFSLNGVPDKYIKLLYKDMVNAGSSSPVATKSQLLLFLKNHPALKSPRVLTTYTSELFQAYKMLGPIERANFDLIVKMVAVDNWVQRTINTGDKLLNKVLNYRKYDPNNIISSYKSLPEELFRYLRNFQEHGGDRDVTTGARNLFIMKDLEFIATYEYCSFIRELIYILIVKTDMKGFGLEYAWTYYTEC